MATFAEGCTERDARMRENETPDGVAEGDES